MYTKIILDYEDLPIYLLSIDDIDCMRLDWVGWIKEAVERKQLRYVLIGDLALIYRPQIDPKLAILAKEANFNIIAFVNS